MAAVFKKKSLTFLIMRGSRSVPRSSTCANLAQFKPAAQKDPQKKHKQKKKQRAFKYDIIFFGGIFPPPSHTF